jgi:hypothetical protein
MYKILVFLKRRPGLSMEEFVDYYESSHSKLGEKYMRGNSTRYLRRYLYPIGHPVTGGVIEPEFDCVTEMWFKDEEQWHTTAASFSKPGEAEVVVEDEQRFLDRSRMRMYAVAERESDVGHPDRL